MVEQYLVELFDRESCTSGQVVISLDAASKQQKERNKYSMSTYKKITPF